MIAATSPLPERPVSAGARSPRFDDPATGDFAPMLMDVQSGIGRAIVDSVPSSMQAAGSAGNGACLDSAPTSAAEVPAAQGDNAPLIETDVLAQPVIGHATAHLPPPTTAPNVQPVAIPVAIPVADLVADLDADWPAPDASPTVTGDDADDDDMAMASDTASDRDGGDAEPVTLPAATMPIAILPVVPTPSAGTDRAMADLRPAAPAVTATSPDEAALIARGGDTAASVESVERRQPSPADAGGAARTGLGRAVGQDLAGLLGTMAADADETTATPTPALASTPTSTLTPVLTPVPTPVLTATPPPAGQGAAPAGTTPVAATPTSIIDMTRGDAWLTHVAGDIARLKSSSDALHFRLHPANLGTLGVTLDREGDQTQLILRVETSAAQRMLADSRQQLIETAQSNGVALKDVRIELNMGAGGHADAHGQARRPFDAETARMLAHRLGTTTSEGDPALSPRTVVSGGVTYRFA